MSNTFDIFSQSIRHGSQDNVNQYDGEKLSRFLLIDGELCYQELSKNFQLKSECAVSSKYYGLDDPLFSSNEKIIISGKALFNLPIPGAASPFEALVNIVFGQQVTLALANKARNGLVEMYGLKKYNHTIFPEPKQLLKQPDKLESLPITQTKKAATLSLAAFFNHQNQFSKVTWNKDVLAQLRAIKGIGEWTLTWFTLCALRDFETLPCSDLGVRKSCTDFFSCSQRLSAQDVELRLNKAFSKNVGCYLHRILLNYTHSFF